MDHKICKVKEMIILFAFSKQTGRYILPYKSRKWKIQTGYNPILYILSKDLIETKKITYIDIEMRLYFPIR